ncbi:MULTISPECIES: flagellar assembly protein FliH [Halomonas]|uniref:Flagellar assembly protein FliH n=1 Tax=Halomonas flagellata TaxID=2920385 RepID=A0ABS9RSX3_9GAMM|nr:MULTISPECIES: flagellar assembly protein FliH [Halomonas]MCH4562957.1 flagellar assembly protein FliH [Halomonas flagellata]PXX96451.1 flagellar assembly protein FliH [Halomonas sp. LBP4]
MSDLHRGDTARQPLRDDEVAWRRWEMDELVGRREEAARDDGPSPSETARRKAAFQRQAELRALREQVSREAREQGHREGFTAGHAEGLAQGLAEGREQARAEFEREVRETLAPLLSLAEQFGEALARLDEAVAGELVELALATGRQLAGEALKARPRQVLETVRALLHSEPAMTGKPRLWLHPLDHRLVEEHLGHELEAAGWTLQPDDQLRRGGCRVTSASGELDATWESRWQAVKGQVRRRRPADGNGSAT